MKANSFLECLLISLTYPSEDHKEGPYFPDVAEAVRNLVEDALLGLDTVNLHRAIKGWKVEKDARDPNSECWPTRAEARDLLAYCDGSSMEYSASRSTALKPPAILFRS